MSTSQEGMPALSVLPTRLSELNAQELVSARGKIQFSLLPMCLADVPADEQDVIMMKYMEAFGEVYPGPNKKDTALTLKLVERWNAADEDGRGAILKEVKEALDEYMASKPN